MNEEPRVLLRNCWKWVLVGRPSVFVYLILALSKMDAEKKLRHLETLIEPCDGSLVGLILLVDLKKLGKVPVA